MITQSEVVALVSAAARPFTVEFSRSAKGITLDRKKKRVTVPLPPVLMEEGKADAYLLQVYDAVAAARWCDDKALLRNKEGELQDSLAYSIAMRRAQAQAMDTWHGDAALYERDFRSLGTELLSMDVEGADEDALKNIAAECVALRQISGESPAIRAMIENLPPQIKRLVDKVPETLPTDPVSAAEAVRRILDIPPPPPSGGDGEGESGKGEGDSDEGGEGEGDGGEGEGDQEGEGKPAKGKSTAAPKNPVEDKIKPRDYGKEGNAIGADGVGEYTLTPEDKVVVVDCALGTSRNTAPASLMEMVRTGGACSSVRDEIAGIKERALDSSLSNHLRRMLQVKMRTRYENGKMSGKVNRRAVHRLLMPTVGDGQWNAKVFRSKSVPKDTLKTAVTILVDYSGSMRYNKTHTTIEAVGALSKALGACHVKHSVLTFTEDNERNDDLLIGLVKDFDAIAQPEVVMDRMASLADTQQENGDADAVAWAYAQLLRRKEPRKVLIVLSDGHPASQRPGSCSTALKGLVRKIETEGKVELYAVGILSSAPQQFYRNNVICNNISELEDKLVHLAGGLFDLYSEEA